MTKVLLKRGLKSNLSTATAEAVAGEAIFTTDTKELFIGTGNGIVTKITDFVESTTAPADHVKLWVDTSANVIKRWDGSSWVTLSLAGGGGSIAFSDITGNASDNTSLSTALGLKADLVSVGASLALKADVSTTYSKAETDSAIDTKIAVLTAGASTALDTFKELSDAMALDESGLAALTTTVASKADKNYVDTQLLTKADASDIINYTASNGIIKSLNDFQLASSVAGTGLGFSAGVLSITTVDGGTF